MTDEQVHVSDTFLVAFALTKELQAAIDADAPAVARRYSELLMDALCDTLRLNDPAFVTNSSLTQEDS